MRVPRYFRLLAKPPALDFEQATWELVHLVISPRKVYKSVYYRQQARSQWSRDDPSFVILLSGLLTIAALAWGIAFAHSFKDIISLVLYLVVVDFLIVGLIVTTISYNICNKFLRRPGQYQRVPLEWSYCFDVHCNAFLMVFLWLYVLQLLLYPIIYADNPGYGALNEWKGYFFGNLLYLVAFVHYSVMTFLGYSILPFLQNTQVFLAPIILEFILYLVVMSTKQLLVNWVVSKYV